MVMDEMMFLLVNLIQVSSVSDRRVGPLTYFTDDFMSNLGWNYLNQKCQMRSNVLLIDSHLADFNVDEKALMTFC